MKETAELKDAARGQTVGIYFSAKILDAGKSFSAERQIPFSRVVATALRDHLAAHNALPTSTDADRQTVLDGLAEAYSIDELRGILSQRTADQAANT